MSRLKDIRELQNLTQEELSQKSGVSVRTVQRIETGKEPKGYTRRVLAKALDVEENELLDHDSQKKSDLSIGNETFHWDLTIPTFRYFSINQRKR